MDYKHKLVNSLINEIIFAKDLHNVCFLNHSENMKLDIETIKIKSEDVIKYPDLPEYRNYDLIIGNFPLGVRVDGDEALPYSQYTVATAIKSMDHVKTRGYGIFLIEPTLLGKGVRSIRNDLEKHGLFIEAYFNLPEDYMKPISRIVPIIILVRKSKPSVEFICEIATIEQVANSINSFHQNINGENLLEGIFIEREKFKGFNNWKILEKIIEIEKETEYKDFKTLPIEKIIYSLNMVRDGENFEDRKNCFYFPRGGNLTIEKELLAIKGREEKYYQLECKESEISPEYLIVFFESKLGKMIHDSMKSEHWNNIRNKETLLNTKIPIPDIKTQNEIINTIKKLNQVKDKISSFEEKLATNPISSQNAIDKIDQILDVVGQLAEEDKILSIIKQGESRTIEFKSSFCLDIKKQTKEKYIQDTSIKSIAGFLNAFGGNLLIGVDDKKNILGIEPEINKFFDDDDDNFLLHFKNILKSKIGEEFNEFIDHKIVKVNNHKILVVNCKQSLDPVYVEEKDFYVRVNPATARLEGPKQFAYIKNHFYKNKFKE